MKDGHRRLPHRRKPLPERCINEEGRRTERRADEGRPAGPKRFGVKSDSHTVSSFPIATKLPSDAAPHAPRKINPMTKFESCEINRVQGRFREIDTGEVHT